MWPHHNATHDEHGGHTFSSRAFSWGLRFSEMSCSLATTSSTNTSRSVLGGAGGEARCSGCGSVRTATGTHSWFRSSMFTSLVCLVPSFLKYSSVIPGATWAGAVLPLPLAEVLRAGVAHLEGSTAAETFSASCCSGKAVCAQPRGERVLCKGTSDTCTFQWPSFPFLVAEQGQ